MQETLLCVFVSLIIIIIIIIIKIKNHKEKATWHAMSGYGCG